MKNIIAAAPLPDYHLQVTFEDGALFNIDFTPFIKTGVSSALLDIAYFEKVVTENGYITWPNGFDFCPEFLYEYAVAEQKEEPV